MAVGPQTSGIPPQALIYDVKIDYCRPLGGGSDATVFPGMWNVPVAVKALHPALIMPGSAGREAFISRFWEECHRLRNMCHRNIVQFMGVCTTRDGTPGLVTERMAETLEQRYTTSPLSVGEQVEIFCDVADGLTYLHSQGIVHRDLTTRNVLLTERGRRGIAKLADVGLSRSLGGAVPDKRPMSQVPGSQLYMAPETFADCPTYNEKLDCFSFGVLMMSTIIRHEPSIRYGSAPTEILPDGCTWVIPEIERRAQDLSEIPAGHPAKRLIALCLQNDPTARPSAHQLLEQLTEIRASLRHPQARAQKQTRTCFSCRHKDDELQVLSAKFAEAQWQLAEKDTALRERDFLIAELLSAQADKPGTPLTEESFMQRVRHYNLCQAGSYLQEAAGFPQWNAVRSPLPTDIEYSCKTTVHSEQLYLSARSKTAGCLFYRSSDGHQWQRLEPPKKALMCDGMLTCDGRLYALMRVGSSRHPVLFELTHVDKHRTDKLGQLLSAWRQLPNGQCPVVQIISAFFADENHLRLIIAGGLSADLKNSLGTISEYSLVEETWIPPNSSPDLPAPLEAPIPVQLGEQVHLIGGQSRTHGKYQFVNLVVSLDIGDDIGARRCVCDALPPTPVDCCAASNVYNTVAIAGGASSTNRVQSAAFVLDRTARKWIALPSLNLGRQWPSLAFFKDSLFAFGGWNGEQYTSFIEQLSLSRADFS